LRAAAASAGATRGSNAANAADGACVAANFRRAARRAAAPACNGDNIVSSVWVINEREHGEAAAGAAG
jgi:hypothetical protein